MTRRAAAALVLSALLVSWGFRFEIQPTDKTSLVWQLDKWTGETRLAYAFGEANYAEEIEDQWGNSVKKARALEAVHSAAAHSRAATIVAAILAMGLAALTFTPQPKETR